MRQLEEEEAKRKREQKAEEDARLELRSLTAVPVSHRTAQQERMLTGRFAPDFVFCAGATHNLPNAPSAFTAPVRPSKRA